MHLISATVAKELAYKEYDKFKIKQDKLYKSDFDNFINEVRIIGSESDNSGKKRKKFIIDEYQLG